MAPSAATDDRSGLISASDASLGRRQQLLGPADAPRSVGCGDVGTLVAGLGLAVEGALERRRQAGINPAEEFDGCHVIAVVRALAERVARDRVRGGDGCVDRTGCDDVWRVRAASPLRGTDVHRPGAAWPVAHRTASGSPASVSSFAFQERGGVAGEGDAVEADLLDEWDLRPQEVSPGGRRVLDELEVVAGPGADLGLEFRKSLVEICRLQVGGDDEQIDVVVPARRHHGRPSRRARHRTGPAIPRAAPGVGE